MRKKQNKYIRIRQRKNKYLEKRSQKAKKERQLQSPTLHAVFC